MNEEQIEYVLELIQNSVAGGRVSERASEVLPPGKSHYRLHVSSKSGQQMIVYYSPVDRVDGSVLFDSLTQAIASYIQENGDAGSLSGSERIRILDFLENRGPA
ncbi:MAG: hypothetical protein Tsb0013_14920 [Phycisphaerales bacterium]